MTTRDPRTNARAIAYALACDYPALKRAALELVSRAIVDTETVVEAADRLGVTRNSIFEWLRKFPELKKKSY